MTPTFNLIQSAFPRDKEIPRTPQQQPQPQADRPETGWRNGLRVCLENAVPGSSRLKEAQISSGTGHSPIEQSLLTSAATFSKQALSVPGGKFDPNRNHSGDRPRRRQQSNKCSREHDLINLSATLRETVCSDTTRSADSRTQIPFRAGSVGAMKCRLRLQLKHYSLLVLALFFVLVLLADKASRIGHLSNVSSNPQDFFIWATNASISYSFRYDPRAADEWLFHSGAWLFATSRCTNRPRAGIGAGRGDRFGGEGVRCQRLGSGAAGLASV